MQKTKKNPVDPLYVIFEQHLYNSQNPDLDRKCFIENVLKDYLSHLKKLNITVPQSLMTVMVEELTYQIETMLGKKIYGYLKIQDYQKALSSQVRRQAKREYIKILKKA